MSAVISVNVGEPSLRSFTEAALGAAGVAPDEATCIADSLIQAELWGVRSHGVQNLPRYARGYVSGAIATGVRMAPLRDQGPVILIDAANSLGIVAASRAMEIAINRAEQTGVAMVGVRNSNHFGAAGYFAAKALSAGMIGYCTTNGAAVMAPSGGYVPLLSNNPFAVAVPSAAGPPFLLDMACSTVARGSIRIRAREREAIPEGWALAPDGSPTCDAATALDGTVLPFGGYKGYGIAILNEILAAALTGALFSHEIVPGALASELGGFAQGNWQCGHLVAAIDPGRWGSREHFAERVGQLLERLRSSPTAPNVERILTPGQNAFESESSQRADGIPVADSVLASLRDLAEELHLSSDLTAILAP